MHLCVSNVYVSLNVSVCAARR
eukprot:COSAG06_NODE_68859_length_200_cov_95.861386_1_plen_21_part_10